MPQEVGCARQVGRCGGSLTRKGNDAPTSTCGVKVHARGRRRGSQRSEGEIGRGTIAEKADGPSTRRRGERTKRLGCRRSREAPELKRAARRLGRGLGAEDDCASILNHIGSGTRCTQLQSATLNGGSTRIQVGRIENPSASPDLGETARGTRRERHINNVVRRVRSAQIIVARRGDRGDRAIQNHRVGSRLIRINRTLPGRAIKQDGFARGEPRHSPRPGSCAADDQASSGGACVPEIDGHEASIVQ